MQNAGTLPDLPNDRLLMQKLQPSYNVLSNIGRRQAHGQPLYAVTGIQRTAAEGFLQARSLPSYTLSRRVLPPHAFLSRIVVHAPQVLRTVVLVECHTALFVSDLLAPCCCLWLQGMPARFLQADAKKCFCRRAAEHAAVLVGAHGQPGEAHHH